MSSSPDPVPDVDTGPLERSQEAIDDAQGAVREAMDQSAPAEDMELPGAGEAADSGRDEEVTPRPS